MADRDQSLRGGIVRRQFATAFDDTTSAGRRAVARGVCVARVAVAVGTAIAAGDGTMLLVADHARQIAGATPALLGAAAGTGAAALLGGSVWTKAYTGRDPAWSDPRLYRLTDSGRRNHRNRGDQRDPGVAGGTPVAGTGSRHRGVTGAAGRGHRILGSSDGQGVRSHRR